jgi:hypothetical protein
MKQRLHWALTITAFVVAVFGVTPLGSATVKTGVVAAKAPLYASGVLTRGPRGPRGPRGRRGPKGPKGDLGPQGARGGQIVARARSSGAITTSGAPGTDDPLTGNTWVQAAGEDDLILGEISYEPACGGYSTLDVNLYVDGTFVGTLTLVPQISAATATFPAALNLPAPAASTAHTLTAKVADSCSAGGHDTVNDLKLDVAALA